MITDFIQAESRGQATLLPERLDDYIAEDNAVRVVDVSVDELDLAGLGFRTEPSARGCRCYAPATMLKLFIFGYLNRVQSSRRLERQRDVELMRPAEESPCQLAPRSVTRQEQLVEVC